MRRRLLAQFRWTALVSVIAAGQAAAQVKPSPPTKPPAAAQDSVIKQPGPDSVTFRILAIELRSAVQIMQQYLDRPLIFTGPTGGPQVTFETPRPVPRADVPRLLRGLLEANGYELATDSASGTYRARVKEQPRTQAPTAPGSPFMPAGQPQSQTKPNTASPELFVIALKHARAADVAATVNTLFGRTASFASNGPRQPTLTDDLRSYQLPPADAGLPQSVPGAVGRTASLSGELTLVPDPRTNSLLVRANRADFQLIEAAVGQIDMRPPQVLIEVLIVEAQRDRSFALGVTASAKDHTVGKGNTAVGGTFMPGEAGLGDFALHVMGASGLDIDATITAASGRGDAHIVSRPVVLTANDEEADVVVGSQRPFVQVSRALQTSSDVVGDQIVQYKDVGTKLTVRPTISLDGSVQLRVTQEVSNATAETQFNAPVISTRSVRTDLLVKDGQTIVLGGLTDRQHDSHSQGIPFLSSIPLLGGLFGSQTRNSTETELFIFLTPRVIRTDEDADRLTESMRQRAGKIEP